MSVDGFFEVFLVAFISLLGFLSLIAAGRSDRSAVEMFLFAFPVGYSLVLLSSIASIAFFSSFIPVFVLGLSALTILLVLATVRPALSPQDRRFLITTVVGYGALSFLFRACNLVIFSRDSFDFMFLASAFADSIPIESYASYFAAYPLAIIPFHALAKYFGQDFSSSLSPLCQCLGLGAAIAYSLRFARLSRIPIRFSALFLMGMVTLFTFSTVFILQQSVYVNSHTMVACLIMLLTGEILGLESIIRNSPTRLPGSLVMILALLLITAFARLEGLLVALLLVLILLETKVLRVWQVWLGAFVLVIPMVFWAQCIQQPTDGGLTLTSSKKVYGAAAPLIGLPILYSITPIRERFHWLRPISLFGLGGALVAYLISNPYGYAISVLSLLSNMLVSVPWGVFWLVVLAIALSPFAVSKDATNARTKYLIVSYIALSIALGALRTPYRLGWGDSANRMMIHIVPLAYFFLMCQALNTLRRPICAEQ